MRKIDTRTCMAYSPLIPAMEALCNALPGEQIEIIMSEEKSFGDLKEYLSEKNIGFREIYHEEKLILQFTKTK